MSVYWERCDAVRTQISITCLLVYIEFFISLCYARKMNMSVCVKCVLLCAAENKYMENDQTNEIKYVGYNIYRRWKNR